MDGERKKRSAARLPVRGLNLTPGTWEVYCPVGDHEERGMRLEPTVR